MLNIFKKYKKIVSKNQMLTARVNYLNAEIEGLNKVIQALEDRRSVEEIARGNIKKALTGAIHFDVSRYPDSQNEYLKNMVMIINECKE